MGYQRIGFYIVAIVSIAAIVGLVTLYFNSGGG